MAIPAGLTHVTVMDQFLDAAGAPATGRVTFTPTAQLVDGPDGVTITPAAVVATLDGTGAFAAQLVALDDPDLAPTGVQYRVSIEVSGLTQSYLIGLQAAAAPQITLSEIAPSPPSTSAPGAETYLTAGSGLRRSQNLADLLSPSTARTSLGLGGAATLNVDTATGTVAAGDDARIVATLPLPALRTWHAALGNRAYAPARIVALGSSTAEGRGSSAWGRQLYAQLPQRIRSAYPVSGVAGGPGFIPAITWVTDAGWVATYPAVLSGGATAELTIPGWAARSANLSATGHTVTYTLSSMTGFQVVYSQFSGAGTFSYAIDGGAATNVNGASGTIDRFKPTSVVATSRGAHTVTVRWVSGVNYIRGVAVYDQDESSGIQMWEGGHNGYTSTDYLAIVAQWTYGITAVQPHLVVIDIGRNDYGAVSQIQPATMQTNITSMITNIRASCSTNPSIVLYVTQRLGGTIAGTQWDAYRSAYQAIASADAGVVVFDLSTRQLSPEVDNTLALYAGDWSHLADKGQSAVADLLCDFLRPR